MTRKYITPKEVFEIYGIKPATLARQRWGNYGLASAALKIDGPNPEKNKRGLILYSIEKIEELINATTKKGDINVRRFKKN
jgi:hypothetical protein